MNIFFGIIIGLLVLMFLVVAHEFGHFIMAKRNGVKVNEFGIGFPPRIIAWVKGKDGKLHKISKYKLDKKGIPEIDARGKKIRLTAEEVAEQTASYKTTVLSLNALPIGGFCAMDGESDADTKKGTFGAASFWSKTKILFGGVMMNWLVAFIILTVLAWTGMPTFIDNQFSIGSDATTTSGPVVVSEVLEGSPAAQAGFKTGDEINAVSSDNTNWTDVNSGQMIIDFNKSHAGEDVYYRVGDQTISTTLNPADSEYLLGVAMSSSQTLTRYTWSAPLVGAGTTLQLTGETFKGLGELVFSLGKGIVSQFSFDGGTREAGRQDIARAGDSVSGPVGIIGVIFPSFASSGPTNLAFLAALISVSLACMNVLPIPALDGGRWLLIAIFRLRGKKLTKETEEKIVSRAFVVLLVLITIITVLDVMKLF